MLHRVWLCRGSTIFHRQWSAVSLSLSISFPKECRRFWATSSNDDETPEPPKLTPAPSSSNPKIVDPEEWNSTIQEIKERLLNEQTLSDELADFWYQQISEHSKNQRQQPSLLSCSQVETMSELRTKTLKKQVKWYNHLKLIRFDGHRDHLYTFYLTHQRWPVKHLKEGTQFLYRFCERQRQRYRKERLHPYCIHQLNAIHFSWKATGLREAHWEQKFQALQAFRDEHGHCSVPIHDKEMGMWIKTQRQQYSLLMRNKDSHLTPEKLERLNDIGFCWNVYEQLWEDRYRELHAYLQRNNGTFPHTGPLRTWIGNQQAKYKLRRLNRSESMTDDRIQKLRALGVRLYEPRVQQHDKKEEQSIQDEWGVVQMTTTTKGDNLGKKT